MKHAPQCTKHKQSDEGARNPGTGASLCEDGGGAVREAMAAKVEATLDFVDLVEVEVVGSTVVLVEVVVATKGLITSHPSPRVERSAESDPS